MNIAVLILTSLVLSVQLNAKVKQVLRAEMERDSQKEFEEMKKEAWKRSKDQNPSVEVRNMADNFMKMIFYNRKYNEYLCVTTTLTGDTEVFAQCINGRSAQIAKFIKMADYIPSLDPPKANRCEVLSRMFEAEFEFPPFDYLKGERINLFDFEKFNECLMRALR
jgi:hypothetical protein